MVSIYLLDGTGTLSRVRLYLPTGTALGAAQAAAESVIPLLRAISDAGIAKFSVSYSSRETDTISPKTSLVASPQAQFIFSLTDTPDVFGEITIPLNPAWLMTDGPLAGFAIDLTLSDVISFTDEMTDNDFCDPFAVDFATVSSAYKREIE